MENQNDTLSKAANEGLSLSFSNRPGKWVSSGLGGLVGAFGTLLVIVIPVVNTWLANAKEISLAQIKNNADQIAILTQENSDRVKYITQRMSDSDKERDLYKSEMMSCQKELREIKLK